MKTIADKVKASVESEGMYNVELRDLPVMKYGKNGPAYEAIEIKVIENVIDIPTTGINLTNVERFNFVPEID